MRPADGEGGDSSRAIHGWRRRAGARVATMRGRGQLEVPFLLHFFFFFLLFLFFFFPSRFLLNRPPTAEIDHRRPPFGGTARCGRSAYQSATGPVHTGQYRALPLGKENLASNSSTLRMSSVTKMQCSNLKLYKYCCELSNKRTNISRST
ncbi:hypothetical protein BHE74_00052668 [Ensete ventricosum]|nr:hypothetical protein BHE74_00052668 [Ensete ventricosum]